MHGANRVVSRVQVLVRRKVVGGRLGALGVCMLASFEVSGVASAGFCPARSGRYCNGPYFAICGPVEKSTGKLVLLCDSGVLRASRRLGTRLGQGSFSRTDVEHGERVFSA